MQTVIRRRYALKAVTVEDGYKPVLQLANYVMYPSFKLVVCYNLEQSTLCGKTTTPKCT